jgi:2-amino-4-hydroxy-6-hydroxymethyldihydropteridine diphosphokinase
MAQFYISLGSNINKDYYLTKGLNTLHEAFGPLTLSSLFESEAVGFEGECFYNLVIGAKTDQSIEQVAARLREIEFIYDRPLNAKKYSSRTLDLDLLLFDNLILNTPAQIPRDEICSNAFVLWPLSEIAGELIHPVLNKTYSQLWLEYEQDQQEKSPHISPQILRKVPLNWQINN